MAFQYGATLRNNQVSQIQTTVGATGRLVIFSGAEPANCAAADPTGVLATIALPAAFLTSTGGVTTIAGTWSVAASGTGTAASFRMYDTPVSAGVCHVQGNTTTDLVLNNQSITSGQTVTVTSFSVTAGNA
jgi:hypothetical protein